MAGFPFPSALRPIADSDGKVTDSWQKLLQTFWARLSAGKPSYPEVTMTNCVFTAKTNGTLVVTGGSSLTAELRRGSVVVVLPIGGVIPLSVDDTIYLTFATIPIITFLPT